VSVERRVVLLTRDPQLAAVANRLLENGDRMVRYRSATELADWSEPAVAAVILDSPPEARRLAYKQVRDRYAGPLIMLLDRDERRPDLPPDGARHFLHRPFKVAELSRLLHAPAAGLEPFEAAVIGAWSRHATAEPPARAPLAVTAPHAPSYRVGWRPSLRRRVRAWAAIVAALMGLLLVFSLSDEGPCAPGCTSLGGAVAGASESPTPLTAGPALGSGASGGAGGGGQPPGSAAASSQPPTPTGLPPITGVGGLIQSINPITSDDLTPPSGPQGVPGVPAPPGVPTPVDPSPSDPPSGSDPPPTTGPPTTGAPTTSPPTTEPPTTSPPTTSPPTTAPPTTAPPTTAPPTTEPPTTEPPTTAEGPTTTLD
jgi:hypothetical protein